MNMVSRTVMRVEFVDIEGARSLRQGVAVVVDVMRAYTVAAWALHRGAKEIRLMDDLEEAVRWAQARPGTLLFKDGIPDPRFDLHNSPRQLLDLDVADRSIVQRTTAGTRAAVAVHDAERIFCTGFACASATAAAVKQLSPEVVTFVVSGGLDAEEDLACAEFIAQMFSADRVEALPYLRRALMSDAAKDLRQGVASGYTGVTYEDVPMCLEVDRFNFAMEATPLSGQLSLKISGGTERPQS